MSMLEVKNLYKSFGDAKIIKGVSFSVEKGEVLVIIGSSGSGKTTLLRCINSLETPNDGIISLDGVTIYSKEHNDSKIRKQLSAEELYAEKMAKRNIGLVFQQFNLFPQYSVMENICLAPELLAKEDPDYSGRKNEINEEIKERALGLLRRVGLEDKKDFYPCMLSGGQQQRVAIARALALNPRILCFDEPTSALDPELTGEVLKVIKSLKSDNTMIVVTHEMEFAKNIADKVIFMSDGVIVEMGTPEQVFGDPQNEKTRNFLRNSIKDSF